MSTLGDALDFGNLTAASRYGPCFSSSTRGFYLNGSGTTPDALRDHVNMWIMSSTGNAIDFGTATDDTAQLGGSSNSVRGVYLTAGSGPQTCNIDYFTLATGGNASYFGDLGRATGADVASGATQTRAIFAGGFASPAITNANNIDYVTIATTGNAQDFGDIAGKGAGKSLYRGCSDSHGGLGGF